MLLLVPLGGLVWIAAGIGRLWWLGYRAEQGANHDTYYVVVHFDALWLALAAMAICFGLGLWLIRRSR